MRLSLSSAAVPALVGALATLAVSACGRSHAPVPGDAEPDARADTGLDGGADTAPPGCGGPPAFCYEDLGDGCCGAEVPPVCFAPNWACSPSSIDGSRCGLAGPECEPPPTACDLLTEAACVASSACVPLYDDFCCPFCVPIGACADCARPQMYRCAPTAEACPTAECGLAAPAHCAGAVPDCSRAMVVAGYRCDVPGCVGAIMAGCAGDCPVECVPVTGDICTAFCDAPQPDCPGDMTPERDGSCFTGRCIAASACEAAAVPSP